MAKTLAIIFGIVLVVLSLLAFVSNPLIGTTGYFQTDAIHNIVHLLVGIILLIAAGAGESASALWLKILGVVLVVLFLDGLVQPMVLGFITSNAASNWLHLILGVVFFLSGYAPRRSSGMATM